MKNMFFKRMSFFAEPFSKHRATFKINSLLKKNFCFKDMELKGRTYEGVQYTEHSPHLSEIILNEPKKLNSLDLKMIKNLLRKVRLWIPYNLDGFSSEGDSTLNEKPIPKVVLVTGNGKAFCAGGDIVTLYKAKLENPNAKILKDFFRYEYLLDYSLTKMTPLQVSFWNGAVMGGGVGLSINSPFKICTDKAVFAMPEGKIGLFTDVGASYFLPRLLNNNVELGLYLGLTGERIKGKDLAVTGVATHYVKEENLEKLKNIIIKKTDETTDKEKLQAIVSSYSDYSYNRKDFKYPNLSVIKYVFKLDSLEKIYERLDNILLKKSENVENKDLLTEENKVWAEKTKKTMEIQSPLSLSVIVELLKRGMQMDSIDEAYDLEAQVVAGFMEDSDFFEGVRSLLVDKDNAPKWKHKHFSEVDHNDMIKKYFDRTEQIDVDPNN